MHRSWPTLLAFLSPLSFIGCHRVSYTPEFLRTDGFRYRAGSAVVGAALDTLRVAVVVVNDSRQQRLILISSFCAPFNRVGFTVKADARKWDSDVWQPPPVQPPTRDSSGTPIIYACDPRMMGLSPRALRVFVLAVPVRQVLGDSLPNGRYRVTARVRINGEFVRGLEAGDVELSSPPMSTPSVNTPSEGDVRGIVLDDATGAGIPGAQVWMMAEPVGAVTNSAGEFRFRFHYGSQFTLLTRICGRENAARTSVPFAGPLATPVTIHIKRPNTSCAPLLRPPWDVGPQDTTTFDGYVHHSWEGDTFVTCDGRMFHPTWAPGLVNHLWRGARPNEGDRVYARVQARYNDDPSTRDLVGEPPMFVWRLLEVRSDPPVSCTHH